MTPDEAREDCVTCARWQWCEYHKGYEDGYEAARRERGPIQAVGKPLPPAVPPHFASEEPQGRQGNATDPSPATAAFEAIFEALHGATE